MTYLLTFFGIILLNVIPFFMPATWTVLVAVSAITDTQFFYLALIGAVGATIGRYILAKLSRSIVRTRFLSDKTRHNIDAVKEIIEKRKGISIAAFFLYAFGPLPTNYIFIAYGLTTLPLRYLIVPFFFGRLASYSFWTYTGGWLADSYAQSNIFSGNFSSTYSIYFIASQILTILALYGFTKINWHKVKERMR